MLYFDSCLVPETETHCGAGFGAMAGDIINEQEFQPGVFRGTHGRNPVLDLRRTRLQVAFWLGPQRILVALRDRLDHVLFHQCAERVRIDINVWYFARRNWRVVSTALVWSPKAGYASSRRRL